MDICLLYGENRYNKLRQSNSESVLFETSSGWTGEAKLNGYIRTHSKVKVNLHSTFKLGLGDELKNVLPEVIALKAKQNFL
jgi:hypothetical protein